MKSSYTHRAMLVLGVSAALSACGPRDDADTAAGAGGTGAAPGEVATTPAPGFGDSAVVGASADAAPSGAMSAPVIMGIVGVANANEIGSSKIAQQKATSREVKAYADDMIREHRAMQEEADQLASKLDVSAQSADRASELKSSGDQHVSTLESTARGAAFDRAYMDGQVQAHQATLQELESLQSAASDEQVRTLLSNAIPKVRAHLERAQRIQQGLGS